MRTYSQWKIDDVVGSKPSRSKVVLMLKYHIIVDVIGPKRDGVCSCLQLSHLLNAICMMQIRITQRRDFDFKILVNERWLLLSVESLLDVFPYEGVALILIPWEPVNHTPLNQTGTLPLGLQSQVARSRQVLVQDSTFGAEEEVVCVFRERFQEGTPAIRLPSRTLRN